MTTEDRFERLEAALRQSNRRLRAMLTFSMLCPTIAAIIWLVIPKASAAVAAENPANPLVLRAGSFEVVDSKGVVRASLAIDKNETPALVLSDEKGNMRVDLCIEKDGTLGLALLDTNQKSRAGLFLSKNAASGMRFTDGAGNRGIMMNVEDDGRVDLHISDAKGKVRAALLMDPKDGHVRLGFLDADGKSVGAMP